MKRGLQNNRQVETSHKRMKHSQDQETEDFLLIWRELEKWPATLKKLMLLYLPEDYLWMFWHYFSKSLWRDAYFSQYEIKTTSGERVIEQSQKGNVFVNLTSLSLYSEVLNPKLCVRTFNMAFPVLRKLSLFKKQNEELLLKLTHPMLEVIRLHNLMLHYNDWLVNFPKLQLLEMYIDWSNQYIARLYGLSGLSLMKAEIRAQRVWIENRGSCTLDISLLPKCPDCELLILCAKRITNIEKMLHMRDKYPVLQSVALKTSMILDQEFIDQVSEAIGECSVLFHPYM